MSPARRSRIAGLALASLAAFGAPLARAADLLAPAPEAMDTEPASEMLDWGSGWYLRGDLTYSESKVGSLNLDGFNRNGVSTTNAWSGGFGVGYKFFDYFRSDVTIDYRTRVGLNSSTTLAPSNLLAACEMTTNARFRNTLGLVNAYVDLGKYWRITPYLGAGVGVTRNQIGTTFQNVYATGVGSTLVSANGLTGDSKTQLAWALMAGAGIAIDDHATLDLGYRYLNLGDAATSTYTVALPGGGVAYYRGDAKKLTAHEFRVGLRYQFD